MAAHNTRKNGAAARAATIAARRARAAKQGRATNRTGRKVR